MYFEFGHRRTPPQDMLLTSSLANSSNHRELEKKKRHADQNFVLVSTNSVFSSKERFFTGKVRAIICGTTCHNELQVNANSKGPQVSEYYKGYKTSTIYPS